MNRVEYIVMMTLFSYIAIMSLSIVQFENPSLTILFNGVIVVGISYVATKSGVSHYRQLEKDSPKRKGKSTYGR